MAWTTVDYYFHLTSRALPCAWTCDGCGTHLLANSADALALAQRSHERVCPRTLPAPISIGGPR